MQHMTIKTRILWLMVAAFIYFTGSVTPLYHFTTFTFLLYMGIVVFIMLMTDLFLYILYLRQTELDETKSGNRISQQGVRSETTMHTVRATPAMITMFELQEYKTRLKRYNYVD